MRSIKYRKTCIFSLIVVLTAVACQAQQFARVGTAGAQFLEIGVDARIVGMGEACIAVDNLGAGALFWNPACAAVGEGSNLMLSHSSWIADVDLNAAAFTTTVGDYGTFGISMSNLSSGEIEVTTVEQQNGTGETFTTSDFMVGLSYSKKVTDRFSMGGLVKYVGERLEEKQASTFCFDVGMLYNTGYRSLKFGAVMLNFGPPLSIDETYANYDNGIRTDTLSFNPYHLPMTFKVGLAWDVEIAAGQHLLTTLDAVHPRDNVERLDFGAEYLLWEGLALRSGYSSGHDSRGFSVGAGFRLSTGSLGEFEIDYAYTDFGVLDGVQRFSMNLHF
jgi:hypothetical protein